MLNYMNILGRYFPGIEAYNVGDFLNYNDIVFVGGSPIPSEATLDSYFKRNKIQQVLELKRIIMHSGTILTGPRYVSTNEDDISTYLLMASALTLGTRTYPSAGVPILFMDGTREIMSETGFDALIDGLAEHFYQTNQTADNHIVAIDALSTKAEVINYDITTGWPANPNV